MIEQRQGDPNSGVSEAINPEIGLPLFLNKYKTYFEDTIGGGSNEVEGISVSERLHTGQIVPDIFKVKIVAEEGMDARIARRVRLEKKYILPGSIFADDLNLRDTNKYIWLELPTSDLDGYAEPKLRIVIFNANRTIDANEEDYNNLKLDSSYGEYLEIVSEENGRYLTPKKYKENEI